MCVLRGAAEAGGEGRDRAGVALAGRGRETCPWFALPKEGDVRAGLLRLFLGDWLRMN